jgi:oxalate decarboxylase
VATAATILTVQTMSAQDEPERKAKDDNHNASNESMPGRPRNFPLAHENPDSEWPPETDHGNVRPFKYSFTLAHKRIDSGGWTRQITVRDLPISKDIAGVEMRLTAGGVRELHWHVESEWALMLYGNARITAVNTEGQSFVEDVSEGDLWLFPPGIPHSIQGLGPDGCRFLLVFDSGTFDEYHTFLLTDWLAHTPKEVLAKNFMVPASTFDRVPKHELYIFQSQFPRALKTEQSQASQVTGMANVSYSFRPNSMKPKKVSPGGEVKIIDSKSFPVTTISAAIVTLRPGGLRELHWHPNADEWQYYVTGEGRMTVFIAGADARTMDFQAGDVGYIPISNPHYIENTGNTDLVFLEMFKAKTYQDISLGEWLAHTPARLVNEHIQVGEEVLEKIRKREMIITPV